jgi:hypothetical protein
VSLLSLLREERDNAKIKVLFECYADVSRQRTGGRVGSVITCDF